MFTKFSFFTKKKLVITSLSLLTSSSLLAACGTRNAKVVLINLPFNQRSTQNQAFQTLVNRYNQWLKGNQKAQQAGYYPVMTHLTGTYKNNRDVIKNQLQVRDVNTPNLSFGYGDDIYAINFAGRLFDFAKTTNSSDNVQVNNYAKDSISKNLFVNQFLTNNTTIDHVDPNGLYLLPMGVSTDLMYISRPVMQHFLSLGIKAKKFAINSTDQAWFKTNFGVDSQGNKTQASDGSGSDGEAYKVTDPSLTKSITDYYGNSLAEATKTTSGVASTTTTISKSDFTSWSKLFDLFYLLAQNFQSQTDSKSKWIASFTQSNLYEIMSFMNEHTNYNQFLWNRNGEKKSYNYDFLRNQSSTQAETLKKVYQQVYKAGQLGAYWNNDKPNTYPSTDFQKGHLAFVFSSNSGYKYLYNPSYFYNPSKPNNTAGLSLQPSDIYVTNAPLVYDDSTKTARSFNIQGGALYGIKSNNPARDHATRLFVQWLSSNDSELPLNNGSKQQNTKFNGMDYYALISGYVPGSKSFWDQHAQDGNNLFENSANKVAFSLFSKLIEKNNPPSTANSNLLLDDHANSSSIKTFVEPVGALSGAFRDVTDRNFKNGVLPDFNTYWANLTKNDLIQSYFKKKRE